MFIGNFLVEGPKVRRRAGIVLRGFQVGDRILQPEAKWNCFSLDKTRRKLGEELTEKAGSPRLYETLKFHLERWQ